LVFLCLCSHLQCGCIPIHL